MNQQNLGSKRTAPATSDRVGAKAHEAAENIKSSVLGQAQQVRDQAHSTREQAAGRIRGVATQLRQMSDTLREDDQLVAGVAERASRGVDSLAQYVSTATPESVVRDTERIARRQPALFYGAAFVAGLVAGRFIKSSSSATEPGRFSDDDPRYERWQDHTRTDRSSGFFPTSGSQERSDRGTAPERQARAETEAATTTGTGVSMPAPRPRARDENTGTPQKGTPS